MTLREAAESPCVHCPWRTSNQGKRHPDGWYAKKNLRRMWAGLRRGESMSCHPTDPRNLGSPRAVQAGYRPAPETAVTRECCGALILQQRELALLQGPYSTNLARYCRERRGGLTKMGIARLVNRMIFGHCDSWPMTRPALNQLVSRPDDGGDER